MIPGPGASRPAAPGLSSAADSTFRLAVAVSEFAGSSLRVDFLTDIKTELIKSMQNTPCTVMRAWRESRSAGLAHLCAAVSAAGARSWRHRAPEAI